MFTRSFRDKVLQQLIKDLKTDDRIVGVVLVGSGAVGFTDRYSDIDIVVVVRPFCTTQDVFQDWVQHLKKTFPVIHHFEVKFNADSFLAGCLLSGCLEVDFGVVSLDALEARKGRWKVIFDHGGDIDSRLASSWRSRQVEDLRAIGNQYASVWHYIIQTVVSIRRYQLWRALHNLEEVRNRGLYLAGLRHGLIVSHFRQIDQLPESVRRSFAKTLTSRVEASEIIRALKAAVSCFYCELSAISVEGADFNGHKKVELEILALLDEFDR